MESPLVVLCRGEHDRFAKTLKGRDPCRVPIFRQKTNERGQPRKGKRGVYTNGPALTHRGMQEATRGFDASRRDICLRAGADGQYLCLVHNCRFKHDRPAAIMRHLARTHSSSDCTLFNRLIFFVGSGHLAKGWVGRETLLSLDIRQSCRHASSPDDTDSKQRRSFD